MRNHFQSKFTKTSLFVRLLISFISIILLLLSFNMLSFTFFKDNIHDEVIRYNDLILNNTSNDFEVELKSIKDSILELYIKENDVNLLYRDVIDNEEFNYILANNVKNMISSKLSSSQFKYLENLILFIKGPNQTIDKDGISQSSNMFGSYYQSDQYTESFWLNEFNKAINYNIYPSDTYQISMDQNNIKKQIIPILIKGQFNDDFYFIALLDVEKIINDLHQSINDYFIIQNASGERLLVTRNFEQAIPKLLEEKDHIEYKDFYIFYKKGTPSDLTYINIIPKQFISSEISKLNIILITLLAVSLVISIIASVVFSLKLRNPVQKIVESIQHYQRNVPFNSKIKEFDIINENLNQIMQKNEHISKNLIDKNHLLRNYAFTNKLKSIYTNIHEIKEIHFNNKPFLFVLYKIHFKPAFLRELHNDQERSTNYFQEYINQFIRQKYDDSVTFQMEEDQILSLIFFNEESPILLETLTALNNVLEVDKKYCYFTLAASSIHSHSKEMTTAYNEVQNVAKQRTLNDETQIIVQNKEDYPIFVLTPNQEQEFRVHLLEGNAAAVNAWMDRILSNMYKKNAFAYQFHQFTENIITKINQTILSLNLDQELIQENGKLHYIHTIEELKNYLYQFVETVTEQIMQKKDEHDYITSFVIQYIEEHYSEDISLDYMGDKLKITGGYLSSYFKEKTGVNFNDYLNNIRIEKAKNLLTQTDMKIHEIAEKVGYQSVHSLIRVFKKIYGITPGEYRKKHSNE